MTDIMINDSWKQELSDEFSKDYFKTLYTFVQDSYVSGTVFPSPQNIFRAFDLCPFDAVRVVILGQDPYHGTNQANGLAFAVSENIQLPPSLKNMFKELRTDLGIEPDKNGDLSRWARQGVLLLNSTLTVQSGMAGSHQGYGWETFTDAVIEHLSHNCEHIVFILWGNYAKKKGQRIDRTKHLVLESAHPSPLSAYNGFFGSCPFSQANTYLKSHGMNEIDWR